MAEGIPELLRKSEEETRQLLQLLERDESELPLCIGGELLDACLTGNRRASGTASKLLWQIKELEDGL